MNALTADFFARPTLDVAQDMLGMYLVHEHPSGTRLVGEIVETEGYTDEDPAFHGWGLIDHETVKLKKEGRGIELFGQPGTAYVYKIYGRYWLLNVVTEEEGTGGAVLIRAVEPVKGKTLMHDLRPHIAKDINLTNGPGKLTEAFDIDDAFHDMNATEPPLYFAEPDEKRTGFTIATSSRIGITKGVDLQWRYFVEDHPYVSNGTPSDQKK